MWKQISSDFISTSTFIKSKNQTILSLLMPSTKKTINSFNPAKLGRIDKYVNRQVFHSQGDVIIALIKGSAPWPAKVTKIVEYAGLKKKGKALICYQVKFYAHRSTALLQLEQIDLFNEQTKLKYRQYWNNQVLRKAVKFAENDFQKNLALGKVQLINSPKIQQQGIITNNIKEISEIKKQEQQIDKNNTNKFDKKIEGSFQVIFEQQDQKLQDDPLYTIALQEIQREKDENFEQKNQETNNREEQIKELPQDKVVHQKKLRLPKIQNSINQQRRSKRQASNNAQSKIKGLYFKKNQKKQEVKLEDQINLNVQQQKNTNKKKQKQPKFGTKRLLRPAINKLAKKLSSEEQQDMLIYQIEKQSDSYESSEQKEQSYSEQYFENTLSKNLKKEDIELKRQENEYISLKKSSRDSSIQNLTKKRINKKNKIIRKKKQSKKKTVKIINLVQNGNLSPDEKQYQDFLKDFETSYKENIEDFCSLSKSTIVNLTQLFLEKLINIVTSLVEVSIHQNNFGILLIVAFEKNRISLNDLSRSMIIHKVKIFIKAFEKFNPNINAKYCTLEYNFLKEKYEHWKKTYQEESEYRVPHKNRMKNLKILSDEPNDSFC